MISVVEKNIVDLVVCGCLYFGFGFFLMFGVGVIGWFGFGGLELLGGMLGYLSDFIY